jgi:UDP-N-acetylmuramyl pentapeptide synthase
MAEIHDAPSAHRNMADYARRLGLEVVAVGTDLYGIAPADDPLAMIGPLDAGTVVLVKASRVAQLDKLAAALVD